MIEVPGWIGFSMNLVFVQIFNVLQLFLRHLSDARSRIVCATTSGAFHKRRWLRDVLYRNIRIETYAARLMVLSCPMLSQWFASTYGTTSHDMVRASQLFRFRQVRAEPVAFEVWIRRPKKPPDGLLSALLVLFIQCGIMSSILLRALFRLYFRRLPPVAPACFSTNSSWTMPRLVKQAFSEDSQRGCSSFASFDSDTSTVIIDNAANCHICNDLSMFVSPIASFQADDNMKVSTAGGTYAPLGFGTVKWSWKDDSFYTHEFLIDEVLYFPESPVNILGVSKFGRQQNEPYNTGIDSNAVQSTFYWKGGRRTFPMSLSGLPELPINHGNKIASAFLSSLLSRVPSLNASRSCFLTNSKPSHRVVLDTEGVPSDPVRDISSTIPGHTGVPPMSPVNEGVTPMSPVNEGASSTTPELAVLNDIGVVPSSEDHLKIDLELSGSADAASSFLCPTVLSLNAEQYLKWHTRLGHLPDRHMKRMSKLGFLPKSFLKLDPPPICAACAFGKAHKRPWRTRGVSGHIRKDSEIKPGDGVSIDQLQSAQPGLIPQTAGFLTSQRFEGATVFVDHFSHFVYVHLMRNLTLEETLEAKASFERILNTFGHQVRSYRADNGRFADLGFHEAVKNSNQSISFCGVGAHFQNGIAERAIKELTYSARTILLDAKRHWPEAISTMLWPLALKVACERMNNLSLDDDGNSPASILAGTENQIIVENYHTFGCPVFVLDSSLQSRSIGPPKWNPRANLGIYVGHSPLHAGSVALVLNPKTGHVSPQFHVVFDDTFSTLPSIRASPDKEPEMWKHLIDDCSEQVTTEAYKLAEEWLSESKMSPVSDESSLQPDVSSSDRLDFIHLETAGLRRSQRSITAPEKLNLFTRLFCLNTHSPSPSKPSFMSRAFAVIENVSTLLDGSVNSIHPFSFSSSASDNGTYTFKEMLQQPDAKQFILAMMEEIQAHEDNEHWEVVPRSSKPTNIKPILAIWSFKRKLFPDGTINKYKARLCAHGGMMQWGVNYWETYAPVVNWISVRLLLSIAALHNLPTTSIDFVLAFPQATLGPDEQIYMEIPVGMEIPSLHSKSHLLRLRKNLYGIPQAGLNWFNYLKDGLEERGFKQSNVDPCLFVRKDVILLMYVDDCIILSKSQDAVNAVVDSLKSGADIDDPNKLLRNKYVLTNEGGITNYLGVEFVRMPDGSFEMKQKKLIERIIESVGLSIDDLIAAKPDPAIKPILCKDLNGLPRKYDWNYRSVVGMLGYLTGSTRPDIAMATHQCAKFSNDPKLSHERAVRRIAKYLLGTQNKGLIFKPDFTKGLECYVDASFADGWTSIDSDDAENVLSRTGYIIYYAGCPIHWVSKLQTEITLSSTEAEYIALSQSMRDIIPMMNLLEEIKSLIPITEQTPTVKCKIFEDNQSCIKVAKAPSMTPRTKHIALKYHHFRTFVQNGTVEISAIGTKEQIADILTKPISGEQFRYLRSKLIGW